MRGVPRENPGGRERVVSVVESFLLSSPSSPSFPSYLYACMHLSFEFMVLHVWLRTVEGWRESFGKKQARDWSLELQGKRFLLWVQGTHSIRNVLDCLRLGV